MINVVTLSVWLLLHYRWLRYYDIGQLLHYRWYRYYIIGCYYIIGHYYMIGCNNMDQMKGSVFCHGPVLMRTVLLGIYSRWCNPWIMPWTDDNLYCGWVRWMTELRVRYNDQSSVLTRRRHLACVAECSHRIDSLQQTSPVDTMHPHMHIGLREKRF